MKSPDRDAADALLPCPFCGPGQSICDTWFDDLAQKWRVGCGRCGASSGTNQDKGAVIASWNCRPAASELATLSRRVAEMEGGIAELLRCSVSYHIMGDAYEKLTALLSPPTRKE